MEYMVGGCVEYFDGNGALGIFDGLLVGKSVGSTVGNRLGDRVGTPIGLSDGGIVEFFVGIKLGAAEGDIVGFRFGLDVGTQEGLSIVVEGDDVGGGVNDNGIFDGQYPEQWHDVLDVKSIDPQLAHEVSIRHSRLQCPVPHSISIPTLQASSPLHLNYTLYLSLF